MTAPRVASANASAKTVRNRSIEVGCHRSHTSGGSVAEQLSDEVKALPQDECKQLIASGVFSSYSSISAENTLALRADLVIPWNKLRAMRRYTSTHVYIII